MTLEQVLFYSLSVLVVGCALLVISSRNPVHSAIFLIGALLNMAGLYLLLDAEFLVGVQVIVYVGGITVLYLFVISLITMKRIVLETRYSRQWPAAIIASGALLAEIAFFLLRGREFFRTLKPPTKVAGLGSTQEVGRYLFGPYALPFEIATVVLLVAIVGAVLMSRKPHQEDISES